MYRALFSRMHCALGVQSWCYCHFHMPFPYAILSQFQSHSLSGFTRSNVHRMPPWLTAKFGIPTSEIYTLTEQFHTAHFTLYNTLHCKGIKSGCMAWGDSLSCPHSLWSWQSKLHNDCEQPKKFAHHHHPLTRVKGYTILWRIMQGHLAFTNTGRYLSSFHVDAYEINAHILQ